MDETPKRVLLQTAKGAPVRDRNMWESTVMLAAHVPRRRVQRAVRSFTRRLLPIMAIAAGSLHAGLTVLYALVDVARPSSALMALAALSTAVFLAYAARYREDLPDAGQIWLAVGVGGVLVLANIALLVALSDEHAHAAIHFALFNLICGALLLSPAALAGLLSLSGLSWALSSYVSVAEPEMSLGFVTWLVSAGLASAIQRSGLRLLTSNEALRFQAEVQHRQSEERRDDAVRVERALHRSQAGLREIIERNPDAVIILRDDQILYANAAFAMAVDREVHRLIGTPLRDLVSDDDIDLASEDVLGNAGRGGVELTFLRADGHARLFEMAPAPMEFAGGPAMLLVGREVVRIPRTHRLDRTDKLGTDLLVLGMERLLSRLRDHPDEEVRQLVQDLALVRGSEPTTDLHEVLPALIRLIQPTTRVRIELELGPVPPVICDADTLCRVVHELLDNAMRAVEGTDAPQLSIRTATRLPLGAVIDVRDNGVGMHASTQSRALELHFSTWRDRLGLGLPGVRSLLAEHGGNLEIKSELGEGATLRVLLPARVQRRASRTSQALAIVVVDRDTATGAVICNLLDEHEVHTFDDPAQALAFLDSDAAIDVILCDLGMPSMPGLELYRRVMARRPDRVDTFAFLVERDLDAALRAEVSGTERPILPRPFRASQLHAVIDALDRSV